MLGSPSSTDAKPPSAGGEAEFRLDEVFFSRTDTRGVIRSGNEIFQRISEYPWDELIGAPHKLIRHDDMPKAVFWIMWDRIKRGLPTGAYVKNRTQSGKQYWVFALVTPSNDGYISIRFKPTSATFDLIRQEYAELLKQETAETGRSGESAADFLHRLSELGFSSYDSFMTHAISEETKARNAGLGREKDALVDAFVETRESLLLIRKEAQKVVEAFDRIALTAVNMRVQAAQLGSAAAPVSAISDNYSMLGEEVRLRIEQLVNADDVISQVERGLFQTCNARISQEIDRTFKASASRGGVSEERDRDLRELAALSRIYRNAAVTGMEDATQTAQALARNCNEMKRILSGLSLTRVLSKIECARIGTGTEGMAEIANQLKEFQVSTEVLLKAIDSESRKILRNMRIRSHTRSLAA